MKRTCTIALIAIALGAAGTASAKTMTSVSYPYEQVFPAAVRFLRIDERMKIVERDAEAGYIVFELEEDGATYRGSFEIARVEDDEGRAASRLVVRLNDRPDYMEQGLIDRFGLKLRQELGDPKDPPPPPPPKKKKPPKKAPGAPGND